MINRIGLAVAAAIACAVAYTSAADKTQASPSSAARAQKPMAVRDMIETTSIANGHYAYGYNWDQDAFIYTSKPPQFVSPDGSRWAAMTFRGDIARNGIVAEIVSGSLSSLDKAAQYVTASHLFSPALGEGDDRYYRGDNEHLFSSVGPNFPFTWIDKNKTIMLFWEDKQERIQVVKVDTVAGKTTYLTGHPTNVISARLSPKGTLFYVAEQSADGVRAQSQKIWSDGFAVPPFMSIFQIVKGSVAPSAVAKNTRWQGFLSEGEGRGAIPVPCQFGFSRGVAEFSPSGKHLIVDCAPSSPPEEWGSYMDEEMRRAMSYYRSDNEYDRLLAGAFARHLVVVAVQDGSIRPLWTPPVGQLPPLVRWSPDERRVLVGPTRLPVARNPLGSLSDLAVAVVDVATGSYESLAVEAAEWTDASWEGRDTIRLRSANGTERSFKSEGKRWTEIPLAPAKAAEAQPIRVELREDINMPPKLVALDRDSGKEKVIYDPNPDLQARFLLGPVKYMRGVGANGNRWFARLYYPANYQAGKRYPLVVQTRGLPYGTDFSLYGPHTSGLGPGFGVFAAQALAGRGMVVLQIQALDRPHENTVLEPAGQYLPWESAMQELVNQGLVDRTRVGVQGFSRSGWWTEAALTQSDFPYAAALVSDNMDSSYVGNTLNGKQGTLEDQKDQYERLPVGAGLAQWLEYAPGFNVQRIRTPLAIYGESNSSQVLVGWEMFSRMQMLDLPVEFFLVPNISRGTHGVRNPRQVLVTKERVLDWFDFWLNDHEDPNLAKTEQYARWRKLREQRDEVLKQPRPPLLKWSATPVESGAKPPGK